jgi:periplasmic divalent cation tolerance protein
MSDVVLVVTTVPSDDVGRQLAKSLLDERLCACVNVLPAVSSMYWWKGKVEEEQEVILFAKTIRARSSELCRRLVELHPYDVPEAVVLDIHGGNPDYLSWVARETK